MNYLNLTPHDITVVEEDGSVILIIPKSGTVARVSQRLNQLFSVDNIKFFGVSYGDVENLPEPIENTVIIVSSLVAARCEGRTDVVVPAEFVRDAGGNIIGCKGFQIL